MRAAQQAAAVAETEEEKREEKRLLARRLYLAAFLKRPSSDIVLMKMPNDRYNREMAYQTEVDGYQWRLESDTADEWHADPARRQLPLDKVWNLKMRALKPMPWAYVHTLADVGKYILEHPPEGGLPPAEPEPTMNHPEAVRESVMLSEKTLEESQQLEVIESERQRSRRWRRG
jgi:hypothetical protein